MVRFFTIQAVSFVDSYPLYNVARGVLCDWVEDSRGDFQSIPRTRHVFSTA